MVAAEREQIIETIEEVNQFRDLGLWNRLEGHLSDTVYVDDEALTRELPGKRTAHELVNSWRRELKSYFYATKHTVTALRIKPKNEREATATTPTTIKYFITDSGNRYVLTVIGTYTYNLVRRAGKWRIGELKFDMRNQTLRQLGVTA